MIPAIKAWRERRKKLGSCQFCWKRKATATKTLCPICRQHKIDYEEKRRRDRGIEQRRKGPKPVSPFTNYRYRPRAKPPAIEPIKFTDDSPAFEREQLRKIEAEEIKRKAVRSAWMQAHGYEQRARVMTLFERIDELKRKAICHALRISHGNMAAAGRLLGMHRNTVIWHCDHMGIDPSAFEKKNKQRGVSG
jgi:hypothetical protein